MEKNYVASSTYTAPGITPLPGVQIFASPHHNVAQRVLGAISRGKAVAAHDGWRTKAAPSHLRLASPRRRPLRQVFRNEPRWLVCRISNTAQLMRSIIATSSNSVGQLSYRWVSPRQMKRATRSPPLAPAAA